MKKYILFTIATLSIAIAWANQWPNPWQQGVLFAITPAATLVAFATRPFMWTCDQLVDIHFLIRTASFEEPYDSW